MFSITFSVALLLLLFEHVQAGEYVYDPKSLDERQADACTLGSPHSSASAQTAEPTSVVISVDAFNECMENDVMVEKLDGQLRYRSCGTAANGLLNCLEYNSTVGKDTTLEGIQDCICDPDGQAFLDGKDGVLPRANPHYVPLFLNYDSCFTCLDSAIHNETYQNMNNLAENSEMWTTLCNATKEELKASLISNTFEIAPIIPALAQLQKVAINGSVNRPNYFSEPNASITVVSGFSQRAGGTLPTDSAYTTVTLTGYKLSDTPHRSPSATVGTIEIGSGTETGSTTDAASSTGITSITGIGRITPLASTSDFGPSPLKTLDSGNSSKSAGGVTIPLLLLLGSIGVYMVAV